MGNRKSVKISSQNSNTGHDLQYISKETGLALSEVELWRESFLNDCPNGKLSRYYYLCLH